MTENRSLLVLKFFLLMMLDLIVAEDVSISNCAYALYSPDYVHTACLVKNTSCNIKTSGVPPVDQTKILELHNKLRSSLAMGTLPGAGGATLPQAANMRQLSWSQELATIAQAFTDQCNPTFRCYYCSSTEEYVPNENLFITRKQFVPQRVKWETTIAAWANYSYSLTSNQDKFKTSSFTEMTWAPSKDIGCGYTAFTGGLPGPRVVEIFYCLYGPGGNNDGEDLYIEGSPCSECSARYPDTCCGDSCTKVEGTVDYQGLCKSIRPITTMSGK